MKPNINRLMVYIHWSTVILIFLAFISIEYRSVFGKHTLFHDIMKTSHLYIGFIILFLTLLRIIIRRFVQFPIIGQRVYYNSLRKFVSKVVHSFLYIWLIGMIILGWCIISAKGTYSIPFGLPAILNIMPRPYVVAIKGIHDTFAYIGLYVIIGHAMVAIIECTFLKFFCKKEGV